MESPLFPIPWELSSQAPIPPVAERKREWWVGKSPKRKKKKLERNE
jgi:hypothetical protein